MLIESEREEDGVENEDGKGRRGTANLWITYLIPREKPWVPGRVGVNVHNCNCYREVMDNLYPTKYLNTEPSLKKNMKNVFYMEKYSSSKEGKS